MHGKTHYAPSQGRHGCGTGWTQQTLISHHLDSPNEQPKTKKRASDAPDPTIPHPLPHAWAQSFLDTFRESRRKTISLIYPSHSAVFQGLHSVTLLIIPLPTHFGFCTLPFSKFTLSFSFAQFPFTFLISSACCVLSHKLRYFRYSCITEGGVLQTKRYKAITKSEIEMGKLYHRCSNRASLSAIAPRSTLGAALSDFRCSVGRLFETALSAAVRKEPPPLLVLALLWPVTAAPTADRPVPTLRDLLSTFAQVCIRLRSFWLSS